MICRFQKCVLAGWTVSQLSYPRRPHAGCLSGTRPHLGIATWHDEATVAICHADGRDLAADMVADGHAWAFVRYSRDYVEEEREAAAVRAGIHGHTCEPVWRGAPERR